MKENGFTRVINKEIRGLHQAAYLLAVFTLGSQVLAVLRDRLLASSFGAGETLDLYYAAFRIPDTLYVLIASLVSIYVLIPFIEEARHKSSESVRELLSELTSFFLSAMSVLALMGIVFAPALCDFLFPTLIKEHGDELVLLTRILLLQPVLLGVSNLFAAYVQTEGRFLVYALAPLLYNLGIIAGVILMYPAFGIAGLALGVVLGALLHLVVQFQFVAVRGMVPRLAVPPCRRVLAVVRTSLPRTLALSSHQIVMVVLVSMASALVVGSISSFALAYNLQAVPLAIIGASYSVAAFPTLTRLFQERRIKEYEQTLKTALRQVIFWSLPAIALFVVLRAQIVRVILGAGAFNWTDTIVTAAVLALFVVSLLAQGIVVLMARAFYAMQRTWIPLALAVVGGVTSIGGAHILLAMAESNSTTVAQFLDLLRVYDVAGGQVLLLALAFSIGMYVEAFMYVYVFNQAHPGFVKALVRPGLESLGAALVCGLGTYLALDVLDDMVAVDTVLGLFVQGLGAGITGLVLWVLILTTCGNKDITVAWDMIAHRMRLLRARDLRGTIES